MSTATIPAKIDADRPSFAPLYELALARGLVAFWYQRWDGRERLSDVSLAPEALDPWADNLGCFDLLDHGVDFRARWFGPSLINLFGYDWSGARLSEMPGAYRRQMRQVLLRASMIRAPAVELFEREAPTPPYSYVACGLPVAGGYLQPTRLLLGLFWRPSVPTRTKHHPPVEASSFVANLA